MLPVYKQHGFLLPFAVQPTDSLPLELAILPHAPLYQPPVDVRIDAVHTAQKKTTPTLVQGWFSAIVLFICYTLKWAKALLASAMRCTSSFFLKAAPSPFAAATISPANLSAMLRPFLSRL